jgi:hypothetical protein
MKKPVSLIAKIISPFKKKKHFNGPNSLGYYITFGWKGSAGANTLAY